MKSNKYLTIGLLTGFIVGGCIGVLAWAFLQNLFAISICAGIGMLIGIVIGTLIDYEKNNHQEKYYISYYSYEVIYLIALYFYCFLFFQLDNHLL